MSQMPDGFENETYNIYEAKDNLYYEKKYRFNIKYSHNDQMPTDQAKVHLHKLYSISTLDRDSKYILIRRVCTAHTTPVRKLNNFLLGRTIRLLLNQTELRSNA